MPNPGWPDFFPKFCAGVFSMSVCLSRISLNRLIQQLESGPAWLKHEPTRALWLDSQRRVNVCAIQEYALNTPLARLLVNSKPLLALKDRQGWPESSAINPAHPGWALEIICLDEEVGDFASWLGGVVNRREGFQPRLPAPPHPLLHWDDLERLDHYLYYLSSVSLTSERAFHEYLRSRRHQHAEHPALAAAH
jgi:hypothetical protein